MPRDDAWFDTLKRWLTLERTAERARLAQLKVELPLLELAARGLVLLDVESTDEAIGLGGRHLVTFKDDQKRRLSTRFSPGDVVTVAPRKAPLDAPPGGIVTSSTRVSLTVAFERPPPPWMAEGRLRIDLASNDVTFARTNAALETWKSSEPAATFCSAGHRPASTPRRGSRRVGR